MTISKLAFIDLNIQTLTRYEGLVMRTKFTPLIVLLSAALSGCFSSNSSDSDDDTSSPGGPGSPSDSATSTTYEVDVDTTLDPSTRSQLNPRLRSNALSEDSFSVIVVNTAGVVQEVVEIASENITQNPDGTWEISVPGDPRLDCLIVTDPTGTLTISVGNDIDNDFPDALFAPTTQANIEIDIASTAAYQNFLENIDDNIDFSAAGFSVNDAEALEKVNDIVEEVKEIVEQLVISGDIDFSNLTDISEALAKIDEKVEDIVKTEVDNAESEIDAIAFTTLFTQGGGGFGSFEMELDIITENNTELWDYIYAERYYVPESGPEQSFAYESYQASPDEDSWTDATGYIPEASAADDIEEAFLHDGQWKEISQALKYKSSNSDGSVLFVDVLTDDFTLSVKTSRTIALKERNIQEYIAGTRLASIEPIIKPSSTFSANAQAYRVDVTRPEETYKLDIYQRADQYNGESISYGYNAGYSLTDFLNDEASTNTSSLKAVILEEQLNGNEPDGKNTYLVAELINNTEKTANIYKINYNPAANVTDSLELLGTTSWSYKNLISPNDAIYISLENDFFQNIPNFDEAEEYTGTFLHVYGNQTVVGYHTKSGFTVEDAVWVYNKSATDDITDALDFSIWVNKVSGQVQ